MIKKNLVFMVLIGAMAALVSLSPACKQQRNKLSEPNGMGLLSAGKNIGDGPAFNLADGDFTPEKVGVEELSFTPETAPKIESLAWYGSQVTFELKQSPVDFSQEPIKPVGQIMFVDLQQYQTPSRFKSYMSPNYSEGYQKPVMVAAPGDRVRIRKCVRREYFNKEAGPLYPTTQVSQTTMLACNGEVYDLVVPTPTKQIISQDSYQACFADNEESDRQFFEVAERFIKASDRRMVSLGIDENEQRRLKALKNPDPKSKDYINKKIVNLAGYEPEALTLFLKTNSVQLKNLVDAATKEIASTSTGGTGTVSRPFSKPWEIALISLGAVGTVAAIGGLIVLGAVEDGGPKVIPRKVIPSELRYNVGASDIKTLEAENQRIDERNAKARQEYEDNGMSRKKMKIGGWVAVSTGLAAAVAGVVVSGLGATGNMGLADDPAYVAYKAAMDKAWDDFAKISPKKDCFGPEYTTDYTRPTPDYGYQTPAYSSAPLDEKNIIAAGYDHTCVIQADRTVACWGGLATDRSRAVPPNPPASLGRVKALVASYPGTCAVKEDDTVTCWGGGASLALPPTNLGKVRSLASGPGTYRTCAVKWDKSVVCWGGDRDFGQNDMPLGLQASSLAVGDAHTCAVTADEDETVTCWGAKNMTLAMETGGCVDSYCDHGQTKVPSGLGKVSSLAGSRNHTCALKKDSTVACWGIGIGNSYQLSLIPKKDVRVLVGGDSNCAIGIDNTISCWDLEGRSRVNYPPSDLRDVQALALGIIHGCAVKQGSVTCWGSNQDGQITVPDGLRAFTNPN